MAKRTQMAEDVVPELLDEPDADQQYGEAIENTRVNKRPRVRMRCLMQLYKFGTPGRYLLWRGVRWRLELEPTVMAGANFRAALSTFFDAVTTIGPTKVAEALKREMEEKRG